MQCVLVRRLNYQNAISLTGKDFMPCDPPRKRAPSQRLRVSYAEKGKKREEKK